MEDGGSGCVWGEDQGVGVTVRGFSSRRCWSNNLERNPRSTTSFRGYSTSRMRKKLDVRVDYRLDRGGRTRVGQNARAFYVSAADGEKTRVLRGVRFHFTKS